MGLGQGFVGVAPGALLLVHIGYPREHLPALVHLPRQVFPKKARHPWQVLFCDTLMVYLPGALAPLQRALWSP